MTSLYDWDKDSIWPQLQQWPLVPTKWPLNSHNDCFDDTNDRSNNSNDHLNKSSTDSNNDHGRENTNDDLFQTNDRQNNSNDRWTDTNDRPRTLDDLSNNSNEGYNNQWQRDQDQWPLNQDQRVPQQPITAGPMQMTQAMTQIDNWDLGRTSTISTKAMWPSTTEGAACRTGSAQDQYQLGQRSDGGSQRVEDEYDTCNQPDRQQAYWTSKTVNLIKGR